MRDTKKRLHGIEELREEKLKELDEIEVEMEGGEVSARMRYGVFLSRQRNLSMGSMLQQRGELLKDPDCSPTTLYFALQEDQEQG